MSLNYETVFTEIYTSNIWGSKESKSGTGSDIENTKHIIRELPQLFLDFNIKSILDLPCGDFNYFKHIPLDNINYIGGDIVKPLIEENNKKYKSNNIQFMHLDILSGNLPTVDLIICRDCLLHIPTDQIKNAINNIKKSKSSYLLTTSHNWRVADNNKNIKFGDWRRINLEVEPFNFSHPMRSIFEGSTRRLDVDRSLCLWKISDLPIFEI
jgi:2-polyprenyl-3-methyl-5-hydroxy-6-metoxy-1,4-benzoquinol methylase